MSLGHLRFYKLQNYRITVLAELQYLFRFVSFRRILIVSLRFVSSNTDCFVSFRFVSFRFVEYHKPEKLAKFINRN